MSEEELLYNEIYEKTKDCDRYQFIKLLMEERRKNVQLQKQLQTTANNCKQENNVIDELEKWLEEKIENVNQLCLENIAQDTNEKVISYNLSLTIKKDIEKVLEKIKELKGECKDGFM